MLNSIIMMINKIQPLHLLIVSLVVGCYLLFFLNSANADVSTKYEVKAVSYQYRIVTVGETLRLNLIGTTYLSDPAVRYQIKHENWIIPSSDWRVTSGAVNCTADGNLFLKGAGLVEVEGKGPDGAIHKAKIFATPRFLTKYVLDIPTSIQIGKDYKVRLLIADAVTNAYELPTDFYELKFTGIEGNVVYNPVNQTIRAIKPGSFIIKVVNNSYTTVPNPQNLIVVPITINPGEVSMGTLKGRVSWRTAREDWFPLPFTRIKLALPNSLHWFDSGIKASNLDGYFDFGQLPTGRYRIIAEATVDKAPIFWIQDVDIRAGKTTDVRLSYLNPTSSQELAAEYRRIQGEQPQMHNFPDKPGSFGPDYLVAASNGKLAIKINGNMMLTNRSETLRTFKNILENSKSDILLNLTDTQNFVREHLLDFNNLLTPQHKLFVLGVSNEYFRGLGLTKSNDLPDNIVIIQDVEYATEQLAFDWLNPEAGYIEFLDKPYLETVNQPTPISKTEVEVVIEPESSSSDVQNKETN